MTMLQLYKRLQHFVFITISVLIILLSCQSLAFARRASEWRPAVKSGCAKPAGYAE